ncbi:MAG: pyridoxamine 5'-phosphate oxidase family protein, partial [Trebonia sp.]
MLETPEEIDRLQGLLDRSAAAAGAHLRDIITDECRLSAAQVCGRLQGMRLLVVATVTADGRPLAGPVDGYLLHGSFYFSSGRNSVRMRHLAARPAVSATHLPSDDLAVSVHGRAELFELADAAHGELRRAMLDHYLPL